MHCRNCRWSFLAAFVLVLVAQTNRCLVNADEDINPQELFAAMDSADIDVRFIPADETRAKILIRNRTNNFLNIILPDVIAAIPENADATLGQFGGPVGQGPGGVDPVGAGPGGGGASQSVGGGIQQGNAGQNGNANGMGMGLMRIAPKKVRKLTAVTVCLEHGKREPNPRITYRLVPAGQCIKDNRLINLCRRLGAGSVDQKTAQAIAWHFANGMAWETLAKQNRLESKYFGSVKYFSPSEIANAKSVSMSLGLSTSSNKGTRTKFVINQP